MASKKAGRKPASKSRAASKPKPKSEDTEGLYEVDEKPGFSASKTRFLKAYKKSSFRITAACEVAGISRPRYYQWRKEDSHFDAECHRIRNKALDDLEDGMITRAIEGWLEPKFYQGLPGGEVRKFDHALGQWFLERHRPDLYRAVKADDTPTEPYVVGDLRTMDGIEKETCRIAKAVGAGELSQGRAAAILATIREQRENLLGIDLTARVDELKKRLSVQDDIE